MLVSENKKRDTREEFLSEKLLKVILNFLHTHLIGGVDHIDESVSLVVVVSPVGTDFTLTTDVPNVQLKTVLRLITDVEQFRSAFKKSAFYLRET